MKGWSNLRSFTPLESKKGKMYAEYTNVGECHGENITMRIWLEDWQNTVVPSGYEDVDAVVVAIDHNKPVIDIKGLLWIKVRFAYYDSKGNPLNVKGYFTLSDLDFKQGFYLADETESYLSGRRRQSQNRSTIQNRSDLARQDAALSRTVEQLRKIRKAGLHLPLKEIPRR